jgi:hypothetical protein
MAVNGDASQHPGFPFDPAHAALDMGAALPLPEAAAPAQEPSMRAVPPEALAEQPSNTAPITGQKREAPPDAPDVAGAAAPQVHAPPQKKARQGTSAFDKLFDEAVLYGAHDERSARKRAAPHAAAPPAAAAPAARQRAAGRARSASVEPPLPADLPVVEMMAERIKAGGRMRAPPAWLNPADAKQPKKPAKPTPSKAAAAKQAKSAARSVSATLSAGVKKITSAGSHLRAESSKADATSNASGFKKCAPVRAPSAGRGRGRGSVLISPGSKMRGVGRPPGGGRGRGSAGRGKKPPMEKKRPIDTLCSREAPLRELVAYLKPQGNAARQKLRPPEPTPLSPVRLS